MEVDTTDTLLDALGITFKSITKDCVIATMPVDNRTKQGYGMLHGGASVALAETVASTGAYNLINQTTEICLGLEINANHVRAKMNGTVTAYAKPEHIGKKSMIWGIKIVDESDQLICTSRCTMIVLPKNQKTKKQSSE